MWLLLLNRLVAGWKRDSEELLSSESSDSLSLESTVKCTFALSRSMSIAIVRDVAEEVKCDVADDDGWQLTDCLWVIGVDSSRDAASRCLVTICLLYSS